MGSLHTTDSSNHMYKLLTSDIFMSSSTHASVKLRLATYSHPTDPTQKRETGFPIILDSALVSKDSCLEGCACDENDDDYILLLEKDI